MADVVIRDGFKQAAFYASGINRRNYNFRPAFDTVVEDVTCKFVEGGVIVRGNKVLSEFQSLIDDEPEVLYETFEEARKVWRPNSIEAVTQTKWHTNFKSIFSPQYSKLVYKTNEFAGWRVCSGWAVKQETVPVEILIPKNVPITSYTDEVTLDSSAMELLEE